MDTDDYHQVVDSRAHRRPENHSNVKQVAAAMEHLPEDQRVILMLVCVEEYSYREAAAMLNVPIGTVMSRLARARVNLNAQLGR